MKADRRKDEHQEARDAASGEAANSPAAHTAALNISNYR